MQRSLAEAFPRLVWVSGEVSGLRQRQRNTYFDLVEPHDARQEAKAKLPVVLLANEGRRVAALLRSSGLELADGLHVRLRVQVDWYVPFGQLRLKLMELDPTHTAGRLAADREAVLRKLSQDGLVGRNGALALSPVPLRVGLVTSQGSAAYHDVIAELERSGYAFRVSLADAKVSGREAVGSLIRALHYLDRRVSVDVICLVRGGGSRIDLAPFDSLALAERVANAPVPVWTGVGHEIDSTVVDVVAHRAHKTPTACAAALVDRVRAAERRLHDVAGRAASAGPRAADRAASQLDQRARRLSADALRATAGGERRIARAADVVGARAVAVLDAAERTCADGALTVSHRASTAIAAAETRLAVVQATVAGADPARLLARGWTITRTSDGRALRSPDQVRPGDVLETTTAGGGVRSIVEPPTGQSGAQ